MAFHIQAVVLPNSRLGCKSYRNALRVVFAPLLPGFILSFLSPIFLMAAFAAVCWMALCATANRFHDMSRTGAWALVPAVIGVAIWLLAGPDGAAYILFWLMLPAYFLFIWMLADYRGSPDSNRFGKPSP